MILATILICLWAISILLVMLWHNHKEDQLETPQYGELPEPTCVLAQTMRDHFADDFNHLQDDEYIIIVLEGEKALVKKQWYTIENGYFLTRRWSKTTFEQEELSTVIDLRAVKVYTIYRPNKTK